jgi:hypothetical protein
MMRAVCILAFAVIAMAMFGEEPPSIEYPNSRSSTGNIVIGNLSVAIDKGVEWQGVKVYLSLTNDLVVVDAKAQKVLWHKDVSAFWQIVGFREVEIEAGKKGWAVQLRSKEDGTKDDAEYYALASGEKINVPAKVPAGENIEALTASSGTCAIGRPFTGLITTAENWEAFQKRLHGESDLRVSAFEQDELLHLESPKAGARDDLKIDFARTVALVICEGDTFNTFGYRFAAGYEDAARILVRINRDSFQTVNHAAHARPYAIFILPRRKNKAYILEQNVQAYVAGPAQWREIFRANKISDPAHELDALPRSRAAGVKPEVPGGLVREIKNFKTREPKKDDDFYFPLKFLAEYSYYEDSRKNMVLHGPFRRFEKKDGKEIDRVKGEFADGVPHGAWTFFNEKGEKTAEATYEYGKGPPVRISIPNDAAQ